MVTLQRPPYAYANGKIVPWQDATIHIGSEALIRGISVFEGVKGYWSQTGAEFRWLALRAHYDRLIRSAQLQHLPFEMTFAQFEEACGALARTLIEPSRDLWIRPTILAVDGHWGENTRTDLVITGYHQEKALPGSLDVGVSTWQRPIDVAYPARIKSAANYQVSRLARIEGRRQMFDDMILLNAYGRVAEATGSCVLMVRNGKVSTPNHYEGCLESITVDLIEALCGTLGMPFERRPIDRSELLVADELALVGTLMEIGLVRRIEHREFEGSMPVLCRVREAFWDILRGGRSHPWFEFRRV